jgi:hypothetical protein
MKAEEENDYKSITEDKTLDRVKRGFFLHKILG